MNTTLQYVIVIAAVSAACGYALWSVYKALGSRNKPHSHGCSSGCSCEPADLKKDILSGYNAGNNQPVNR